MQLFFLLDICSILKYIIGQNLKMFDFEKKAKLAILCYRTEGVYNIQL